MHASQRRSSNVSPYQTAFHRIRAEFMEMPGMQLTRAQVQRLAGVSSDICRVVLDDLVRARFLRVGADATYVRFAEERLTRATYGERHANG
jgi:hypothetical protein